jgi:hypothetical protein
MPTDSPIVIQTNPSSGGSSIPWGLLITIALIGGVAYYMYHRANSMSGGLLGMYTGTGGGLIGSVFGNVGGSGIFGSVLNPLSGLTASENSDEY